MKRSNALQRKTPLKASGSQRLEPERALAVWCEIQLAGCDGRAVHRHERKRRAQGGDGARANTLDICSHCHRYVHSHVSEAFARGWLVEHWRDPAEVPCSLSMGVLVQDLLSDG